MRYKYYKCDSNCMRHYCDVFYKFCVEFAFIKTKMLWFTLGDINTSHIVYFSKSWYEQNSYDQIKSDMDILQYL